MERLLEGSSDPEKPPRPCGNCGKERQGQPEESSDPLTLNPGTGPAAEGAGAAPSSPHPGGPRHSGNAGLLARRGSPVTVCTQTWCPCRRAGSPGRGWGLLLLGRRPGLSAEQDRVEAELAAGDP